MKNQKMFVLAVIVLTLALLACGIGGGGAKKTAEVPATAVPSEEQGGQEQVAPTEEAAAPTEGAAAEQDLTLPSVTEGLATLQSYKSTYILKFDGKDADGQPVQGTMEVSEDYTQEPKAQRVAFTSTGFGDQSAAQGGTFEIVTIGDMSYMITQDADGKNSCVSVSSSEGTQMEQGLFSPNMLGGISGAKYVGRDTVNGIKTKHYTWKEGGLTGLGFTSAKGEVWVAEDGNYTVKYTAEATGKGALFGTSENEGTLTVEYNLTDVNGSFTIERPADCAAPATDIPLMADAQEKAIMGEMISYSSPSAFADVVAFYKAEMPNNGWQPSGEPTEMEGLAQLDFTKDTRKAQVTITYDTDKQLSSVIVSTSTAE
jgi:hypothetical protein